MWTCLINVKVINYLLSFISFISFFQPLSSWLIYWISICNCLHTYTEEYFPLCQDSLWSSLEIILYAPDLYSVYFVSFRNLSILGKKPWGLKLFSASWVVQRGWKRSYLAASQVVAVSSFLNWQYNNGIFVSLTRLHNIYTIKITSLDFLWKLKTLKVDPTQSPTFGNKGLLLNL